MFSKARLLDVLSFAHQQEMAFIDTLPDDERAASGAPDQWSAKDMMAHLATWKLRLLDRLQAVARGEPLPDDPRPDDQINAEIYAAHHAKTWDEVRAMVAEAHNRTLIYARTALEAELTKEDRSVHPDGRPPWIALLAENVSHAVAHLWDYQLHHGRPAEGVALQESVTERLRAFDDPGIVAFGVYNLACVYARAGQHEQAIEALGEALRLRPALAGWSQQDPDLDSLRDLPGYRALYA